MTSNYSDIQNPAGPAPLTYGAIGDSYGFCFEFVSKEFIQANNDLHYHQHPEFGVTPGVYSDDTQMQLALAEVIASEREWSASNLASSFVEVFKRDPRQGYSRRLFDLLSIVTNGDEFLTGIAAGSEGNGAAMRSPIVGLFSSIDEVIGRSEIQARITHDTKVGVDSATAAALMSHFYAYNLGPKTDLPKFLDKLVPGYGWGRGWTGLVEVHGIQTVRAALEATLTNDTLADVLKGCVNFSGDVDSVAAIALASASGYNAFKKDIPENLWRSCECSAFGLAYLLDLDRRVKDLAFKFQG